jgi:hypothetical protein
MPCAAGAKGDGGGGMWVERSELGTRTGGIERRRHRKAVAHERQEVKVSGWTIHGDEEVAAGGGSGSSWRARVRAAGERKGVGVGRRRRVGTCRSWRWSLGRGAGGKRRWQEQSRGGSGGDRGRRSSRCQ